MAETPGKALVIGASRGIGAALVRELASRGCTVAAVSRSEEALQALAADTDGQVRCYPHDVCETKEVPDLFRQIEADLGGLDMVIYNAGVMPRIGQDTYDFDKDRQVVEVNLLGCIAWLNCAAPYFHEKGSGSIVGISSIAGDRGRVGYPVYNSSKAGMTTYLEALRNRLHRHGVRVTTIKPGFIDTDMVKGMDGLMWLCPSDKAARLILKAARSGATTRYVPRRWALVGLAVKSIPSFIFRRMDI